MNCLGSRLLVVWLSSIEFPDWMNGESPTVHLCGLETGTWKQPLPTASYSRMSNLPRIELATPQLDVFARPPRVPPINAIIGFLCA